MKLSSFIRPAVSAILMMICGIALGCGPFYPIIPTPEFFRLTRKCKTMGDYDRAENLLLWQKLTSPQIPLSAIEEAVYKDSSDKYSDNSFSDSDVPMTSRNAFYIYLINTNDEDIIEFLKIAKYIENDWARMRSPWIYPKEKGDDPVSKKLVYVIETLDYYNGDRLKDRYALQKTRVLFALKRYAECAEYVDSAFAEFPDSNLMKRMAERYQAGCWSRLGDKEKANEFFAKNGDIWSIVGKDPVVYMMEKNPNAPQIIEYIRDKAKDKKYLKSVRPTVEKLSKDKRVKCKGDWLFTMAYIDVECNKNTDKGKKEIYQALGENFSDQEIADLARAYKMKLDALTGDMSHLAEDLRWMEDKFNIFNPQAQEWIRRCQNIIYAHWIPQLWKQKDYTTAILMSSYVDNLNPLERHFTYSSVTGWKGYQYLNAEELRNSHDSYNKIDYANLTFQLMESLTSEELERVYADTKRSTPLYDIFHGKAYMNEDYVNELIGTMAMREENYARAERFFAAVSDDYVRRMNVYKGGYLKRNPFVMYPTQWESNLAGINLGIHTNDNSVKAKLNFARRMKKLRENISNGNSADVRAMAQLMYAIGYYNSYTRCWALTQYQDGFPENKFDPDLDYYDNSFSEVNYPFLYSFGSEKDYELLWKRFEKNVNEARKMASTEEGKAQIEYTLGNLKTVVKLYGNTPMANFVRKSCDRWQMWL